MLSTKQMTNQQIEQLVLLTLNHWMFTYLVDGTNPLNKQSLLVTWKLMHWKSGDCRKKNENRFKLLKKHKTFKFTRQVSTETCHLKFIGVQSCWKLTLWVGKSTNYASNNRSHGVSPCPHSSQPFYGASWKFVVKKSSRLWNFIFSLICWWHLKFISLGTWTKYKYMKTWLIIAVIY